MSAYFTISGNYYSGEAGRVVYFDNQLNVVNIPQVRRMPFGDGYGLHIPVAPILRAYLGTFSNREPSEIIVIKNYFELLLGALIPDLVINGESINARVVNFDKSYQNGEVNSISVQIQEEFR